jgi:hypothetical protein
VRPGPRVPPRLPVVLPLEPPRAVVPGEARPFRR